MPSMGTSETVGGRVVFLTFHKCGSQWVADVLTSHRILAASGGFSAANRGVSVVASGPDEWLECPSGTLSGPIYDASYDAWKSWARPGDKAVVVLRDPRDVVVSWLFSAAYSHRAADRILAARPVLQAMDRFEQILLSVANFIPRQEQFASWGGRESSATEYVTSYERLVRDGQAEFGRIFEFLDWPVPAEVSRSVVEEHSFRARSGRERGDENVHSHFRKGLPGDWASHFDRDSGQVFELLLPGLLATSGYEADEAWFERLPRRSGQDTRTVSASEPELHELKAEVAGLREQNRVLQGACDERLELINLLDRQCTERSQRIDQLQHQLEARSSEIGPAEH